MFRFLISFAQHNLDLGRLTTRLPRFSKQVNCFQTTAIYIVVKPHCFSIGATLNQPKRA
jgi:hypothetical protein